MLYPGDKGPWKDKKEWLAYSCPEKVPNARKNTATNYPSCTLHKNPCHVMQQKIKFRSQYCDKLKKPRSMDQMSYTSLNKSDIKPSPSPVRATTLSTNRKQRSGNYNRHLDTNADAQ